MYNRRNYKIRQIKESMAFMRFKEKLSGWFSGIEPKKIGIGVLGSAIVAFGIYNIHDVAHITEGGILGLTLLLEHWFRISPAYSSLILTVLCFVIGWKALGRNFVVYSAFFAGAYSLFYRFLELFTQPLFPQIVFHPWIAAVAGSIFVGVGAGLSVRAGGAQGGDDALAMAFRQFLGVKLSTVYMISDLVVLLLSLTYIPFAKIICSVLTVILSGQIIEFVSKKKIG